MLGVLVISGEYSTGMIRSSLMAVPRRLPVLWAKIGVFAAVTFLTMLIATLISFYSVQPIVTHALRWARRDAAQHRGRHRHVRGTVVRAARHQRDPAVERQQRGVAVPAAEPGTTVASHSFDNSHHLATWAGFAVFCAYAAAAIAGASLVMLRRDA